jgi:transcriptional regulator with XRE-family HTH domain
MYGIGIRQKIRRIRKGMGYRSGDMAHCLGISTGQYSRMERGRRRITVQYLEAIADILGITVSDLYRDC